MICPKCGNKNEDNWPISVEGKIINGGCQICWESECDDSWWERVILIEDIFARGDQP